MPASIYREQSSYVPSALAGRPFRQSRGSRHAPRCLDYLSISEVNCAPHQKTTSSFLCAKTRSLEKCASTLTSRSFFRWLTSDACVPWSNPRASLLFAYLTHFPPSDVWGSATGLPQQGTRLRVDRSRRRRSWGSGSATPMSDRAASHCRFPDDSGGYHPARSRRLAPPDTTDILVRNLS